MGVTGPAWWCSRSVPAKATYAPINLKSAANTGTVWFDDVSFSPYVITTYNTGFEQGAGTSPSGWQVYRPNQGTFGWDTAVSHGGVASASITNATGDSTGTPAFTTNPIITPLEPGQQFQASVWAKGNATTGTSAIAVVWFDSANHYLSESDSRGVASGTTPWTQLSVVATTPAGAAYAQLDLQSLNNTGTVWFDDVTLTPFTLTVYNTGFEQGTGSVAAGWQSYRTTQGTFAWDSTVSRTGVSSVSLSNTTGDATGTPSFFNTPVINPIQAGQQYQASVWAMGNATTGTSAIAVVWFDSANHYLGPRAPPPLAPTPWRSAGSTPPAGISAPTRRPPSPAGRPAGPSCR